MTTRLITSPEAFHQGVDCQATNEWCNYRHHWVNGTCHCGATQTTWDAWITDEQTNRRGQNK